MHILKVNVKNSNWFIDLCNAYAARANTHSVYSCSISRGSFPPPPSSTHFFYHWMYSIEKNMVLFIKRCPLFCSCVPSSGCWSRSSILFTHFFHTSYFLLFVALCRCKFIFNHHSHIFGVVGRHKHPSSLPGIATFALPPHRINI